MESHPHLNFVLFSLFMQWQSVIAALNSLLMSDKLLSGDFLKTSLGAAFDSFDVSVPKAHRYFVVAETKHVVWRQL